ncbi:MAG: hypothetical protein ABL999_00890 [Pyrinomonadaceae bacterium]
MYTKINKLLQYPRAGLSVLTLLFLVGTTGLAQEQTPPPAKEQIAGTAAKKTIADVASIDRDAAKPVFQPGYLHHRNVQIGMVQDKAREILGKPKDKGDDQDLFVFSRDEMTQVFYDAKGAVRAISSTYMNDLKNAPTALTVIGQDVPPEEDGSIYKMVRYPEAGYWVSYHRTGGKNQIITVTMQTL